MEAIGTGREEERERESDIETTKKWQGSRGIERVRGRESGKWSGIEQNRKIKIWKVPEI